jgi:hypothetical protein
MEITNEELLKKHRILTYDIGIIKSINPEHTKATVTIDGQDYDNVPISTTENLIINNVVHVEYLIGDFSHKYIARKRPY